jgi:hypothetical protein
VGSNGAHHRALPTSEHKPKVCGKQLAAVYATLGDREKTLQTLDKAYEERASALIYLKVDRAFDGVRSDPRVVALLRRMNLQ